MTSISFIDNIHLPLASASGLTQIPTDVLTSLLASVEDLRNDVIQLRSKNTTLGEEVMRLQDSSDSAFYRFSKLPPEIRRMAGTEALVTPQTTIMMAK